jgi:DNA-binding PucR family transcriptional regulator
MPAPKLSREQIQTLETLFARQLNVSEAARQLYLHRNTLIYRLDKLTEETGLDPRQFPDAVLLQLFLLFRQN